jgi:tripeptide aminopeptidase
MSSALKSAAPLSINDLLANPRVAAALRFFEENAAQITEEQIRICSVPATPFGEHERALYLSQKFIELGLSDVELDGEGNCLGLLKGQSDKTLVVSAHLDTVFPVGTDFTVRRENGRLLAPGISDDGCGLTALIAIAHVFREFQLAPQHSILFVGTVGEEGEGNLRGVKYLLTQGKWADRVDAFISFDGPGVDRITNKALGSRRYKVEVTGPGGHSWGDFGVPNPVHALSRAVSRLANYPVPREPRTTFNVGRIEGGASVNSIPAAAVMEVDLRSAADAELKRLDAFFRRVVVEAIDSENRGRRPGDQPLDLKLQLVGERPSGETRPASHIVEVALQATRAIGVEPRLDQSSTDSNLPISLGIPAITLGAGGVAAGLHTLSEWFDPRDRDKGLKRGLLVILGLAGLAKI